MKISLDELRGRAIRALREAGWRANDKLSLHSVIETMIAFGINIIRDKPASCGWPDCGCDADAVCNAALVPAPAATTLEASEAEVFERCAQIAEETVMRFVTRELTDHNDIYTGEYETTKHEFFRWRDGPEIAAEIRLEAQRARHRARQSAEAAALTQLCEQLKRERDEARRKYNRLHDTMMSEGGHYVMHNENEELKSALVASEAKVLALAEALRNLLPLVKRQAEPEFIAARAALEQAAALPPDKGA